MVQGEHRCRIRKVRCRRYEVNRQVWLTALGAMAQAGKAASVRSTRTLAGLIRIGELFETSTRQLIEALSSAAKTRIVAPSGTFDDRLRNLENFFDDRVASALSRMGMPTVRVISELVQRVERLQRHLLSKSESK